MMKEMFSIENNQNQENKEQPVLDIKEAETEDIAGIISILKENLLPREILDREKRGPYLKNTGKKIEDFSEKGFLVKAFSEEELKNIIQDRENHITLIAQENDNIVGYAMTYDLKDWRKHNPDWEKLIEFIDKEEGKLLEKENILYFRHIATKQFSKIKGVGAKLEYKIFFEAKQKGYEEIIGEALEHPIENKASLDFHKKIGFKKIGTIKEFENELVWGLYKKDLKD